MTAYLVAVAMGIPFSSWLAERFGPRRVFTSAILVFTLASAGLWASGHHTLGVALLVFSLLVNAAAQLPSVRVLVRD